MPQIMEATARPLEPPGAGAAGARVGTGLGTMGARAGAGAEATERGGPGGRGGAPAAGGGVARMFTAATAAAVGTATAPAGGGGTVKSRLQVGQLSELPAHAGVPERCWSQWGQENLYSLMVRPTSQPPGEKQASVGHRRGGRCLPKLSVLGVWSDAG